MNYKLTIHCTKEHLEKAKWCGIDYTKTFHQEAHFQGSSNTNCWIAIAVQDILPFCSVKSNAINNVFRQAAGVDVTGNDWSIDIPLEAQEAIEEFDGCKSVEERMKLQPFSFTVDIPQETLDIIMQCNGLKSMQQFSDIIFRTPHLELIEAPQMS